jgi:hypothetical protein
MKLPRALQRADDDAAVSKARKDTAPQYDPDRLAARGSICRVVGLGDPAPSATSTPCLSKSRLLEDLQTAAIRSRAIKSCQSASGPGKDAF